MLGCVSDNPMKSNTRVLRGTITSAGFCCLFDVQVNTSINVYKIIVGEE